MTRPQNFTALDAYDLVQRAYSVIRESDGADEHAELLTELEPLIAALDLHAAEHARESLLLCPRTQPTPPGDCDGSEDWNDLAARDDARRRP